MTRDDMRHDGLDSDGVTDEALVALADGELEPAEAARLRAVIEADPALAERYALFAETGALLGSHGIEDDEAGNDRLAATIRAAAADADTGTAPPVTRGFRVIEGGGQKPKPAAPKPAATKPVSTPAPRSSGWRITMPALAASLALVIGGSLGYMAGRGGGADTAAGGLAAISGAPGAERALASALEKTPSGETLAWNDGRSGLSGEIALIATHRLKDGRVCREYEARVRGRESVAAGLGCRDQGGAWRTDIAAMKPAMGPDYASASGASVIEGAIEAAGGEGAMAAAEEKSLIASGWKKASQ